MTETTQQDDPKTMWGAALRWALGQEANTVLLVLILAALGWGLRDFFQSVLPGLEERHRIERDTLQKSHREERDLLLKNHSESQTQWRDTYRATIDALKDKGMAVDDAPPKRGNPVAAK